MSRFRRNVSFFFAASFFFAPLFGAYAADERVPGLSLSVPGSIGGAYYVAPSALFSADPRASAYNPAAGADRELPAFGAAASLAFPSGEGSGAGGYGVLSAAVPTAVGTLYALADGVFADKALTGFASPSGVSALLGLSKKAGDQLAFGLSVGAASLSADDRAGGVYGAFGAEFGLPALAAGGTAISAAVLSAGKPASPWDVYAPVLDWTPVVAISSRLVDARSFSLTASGLVAAPGFSELALSLGASFGIGRYLNLDLGWLLSLSETVSYLDDVSPGLYAPRFFPSVSARFDGSSFLKAASYGAALGASYRPLSGAASAAESSVVFSRGTRDIEGPRISAGPLARAAFSPLAASEIRVPLGFSDASPIVAWEAVVYDGSGEAVHRVGENKLSREKKGLFGTLFSLRGGVKPPSELRLPLGRGANDGEYRVRVWARDLRGNEGRAEELRFRVDGTPPEASAVVSGPSVFTPNGDGYRDSLSIRQTGSEESLWIGAFADSSGKTVREFRWTDGAPTDFAWNGDDSEGNRVPDGEYSYVLSSTDVAGNAFSFRIERIAVDAEPTPLSVKLHGSALSPDRDGAFDSSRLTINAPVKRGLLEWRAELVSDTGAVFRSWSGSSARLAILPDSIDFDGRNRDGDVIPDGVYRFRVGLSYANGNAPSAVSEPLVVDTRKPDGRVRASLQLLSPDRGERQVFYHDLSPNARWRGLVTDAAGALVRTIPLPKGGETSADWNLFDDSGNPVGDGVYRYAAEGTSATGIVGLTQAVSFRVESGGAAAAILADRSLFSPAVAGSSVRFLPRLEKRDRAVSYVFEIAPSSGGSPVRRLSGVSLPPSSFSWDGSDDSGRTVPDGQYRAFLTVNYENGGQAVAAPAAVLVDATPPKASLKLSSTLFSPNGRSARGTIGIEQSASPGDSWYAEIIDEQGRPVFARDFSTAPPAVFVWDGKTSGGVLAPDGLYRYRLIGSDAAGNESRVSSSAFRLDARIPSAVLSSDKFAFSPNGDGFADTVKLTVVPSFSDGLSSVALRIVDGSGKTVRSFPASARPGDFIWDGASDEGRRAPDGGYKAVAELRYEKGDAISVESGAIKLDATPPAAVVELSPLPFSPDEDGENDLLSIRLAASDASPIAAWSFSILDPEGYPFASFSGKDVPAQPIVWDGTDADGNLVEAAQDYPYIFLARDQLGNTARAEGKIPIDILVLRDGDRLKIRVSSITFAPNQASFRADDPELAARNRFVLDRIAAVLGKFPAYRVRVEGHAVNLSGTEREERTELEPLSLARARTVMDALASRGIARERLDARGLGGREPIVPHGDLQARWRNRRVEFILVR